MSYASLWITKTTNKRYIYWWFLLFYYLGIKLPIVIIKFDICQNSSELNIETVN